MVVSSSPAILQQLWAAGVATCGFQGLGFLHGYFAQTEKFYDTIGGLNSLSFVALGVFLWTQDASKREGGADRQNPRKIFLVSLFALARLWLLSLLFYRAQKRCGDSRFDKIKPFFFKYLVAWVLQGIWCFFIAAPLFVVNGSRRNVPLNGVDYFLIAGMASSIMLEVVADVTKFRWVSSGRPGGFCDVGVWRWSRHPNYFAEIAMWWFAWALTLRLTTSTGEESPSVDWGWSLFALLSPLTTMGLLLFVSGLPLCEGAALKRYLNVPGFQEYRENTSILVPIPKGIWKVLPMWVRRCVFCELRRYEYREGGKNAAGAVGGGAG